MRFFGMISMIQLQWSMVLLLFYIYIDVSGNLFKMLSFMLILHASDFT